MATDRPLRFNIIRWVHRYFISPKPQDWRVVEDVESLVDCEDNEATIEDMDEDVRYVESSQFSELLPELSPPPASRRSSSNV